MITYLDFLGFGPQDLGRGGTFLQELTERVLLKTHVADRTRRLRSFLPRMHEHKHLLKIRP